MSSIQTVNRPLLPLRDAVQLQRNGVMIQIRRIEKGVANVPPFCYCCYFVHMKPGRGLGEGRDDEGKGVGWRGEG